MLKSILFSLFLGSFAQALPTIPDGTYEGGANWKDSTGRTGQYKVSTYVKDSAMLSSYFYNTGKAIYAFRMEETGNGFFDVMYNGKKVGTGHCMQVQCHYSADFGGVKLEETLTFWQGNLYRVGSKEVPVGGGETMTIAWEEALKKVK
jgi:hypothetical protein